MKHDARVVNKATVSKQKEVSCMSNKGIRKAIKDANVTYWQVADVLGVSAATFTVWLRFELDDDKRQRVLDAIKKAAAEEATA